MKFIHWIKQKTVLPTPGICATMKPILPLPPPFGESEGSGGVGGGHETLKLYKSKGAVIKINKKSDIVNEGYPANFLIV